MHLVIVSPFPPSITGVGQYGFHVTRALSQGKLFSRITVLAGSNLPGTAAEHAGLADVQYCWRPGQLNAGPILLSRLTQLQPDLVWFNLGASVFGTSPLPNLAGLLTPAFASRKFPTVVTLHELAELSDLRALHAPGGPFALWGARLLTALATNADVICVTLQRYADQLSSRGLRCIHIPIGAYYEPEKMDESPSQELLFFATLAPYKGLESLLDAFQVLRTKYPRLQLTIAGTEHSRFPAYARKLKRRLEAMPAVRQLGEVSEADVKQLFRRAQVVVLPYIASTGSSSVLYQAAAWGRSVVLSNLDEMQAVVHENGLQAQFFETSSVESLVRAVGALLDSPSRRSAQIQHNYNSIQQVRPALTIRRYIDAFNRALEKRGTAKHISIPPLLETSAA